MKAALSILLFNSTTQQSNGYLIKFGADGAVLWDRTVCVVEGEYNILRKKCSSDE